MIRQDLLPQPLEVKIHLKTHNGEKPNATNVDSRLAHLKAHSGEKPNKCKQCDFKVIHAANLRPHLKAHSEQMQLM